LKLNFLHKRHDCWCTEDSVTTAECGISFMLSRVILSSYCAVDCGNHVRRLVLARDARRAVRQRATNHLLQEVGEHSYGSAEWSHDAIPQSLRLADNPRHITRCSQHWLRRKIL